MYSSVANNKVPTTHLSINGSQMHPVVGPQDLIQIDQLHLQIACQLMI